MRIAEPVKTLLNLIDEVLEGLGQAQLLNNEFFLKDKQNSSGWISVELSKMDAPYMLFSIDADGVSISIDRIVEAAEWSTNDILDNVDEFKDYLNDLFECRLSIVCWGDKITKIIMLDENGIIKQTITDVEFLPIWIWRSTKEFRPIFSPAIKVPKDPAV